MSERKREKKVSDPKQIAARLDRAQATGAPIEIHDDEVTQVVDLVLARGRRATDDGVAKARECIQRLSAPKVPA